MQLAKEFTARVQALWRTLSLCAYHENSLDGNHILRHDLQYDHGHESESKKEQCQRQDTDAKMYVCQPVCLRCNLAEGRDRDRGLKDGEDTGQLALITVTARVGAIIPSRVRVCHQSTRNYLMFVYMSMNQMQLLTCYTFVINRGLL